MKQSLQLCMGQHLTLTPQLQQAIRLLQLSTFDLQLEIQQAVDSNPLLEASPSEEKEDPANYKQSIDEFNDYQWSQLYNTTSKQVFNEPDFNYENINCTRINLRDHLCWQLNLTPLTELEQAIATAIIDAIDDDGFLTQSVEELHISLSSDSYPVDISIIEQVRKRVQQFDPVGCGAINLSESLVAQLEQYSQSNHDILLAKHILIEDIDLLGQHNYRQLMKNHHVNEATLNSALTVIQRLNPKPGSLIQQAATQYIIPDITVKKTQGQWQVYLNQHTLPKLSINYQYASMIKRANNSADNQFLKNNLQEARWFLKSIQSRQETLLRVATSIVNYQIDFFEHGPEAMKPLILNEIAQKLGLHESTISRVTTQKFMHTPRGVFELKYFFSSHVATSGGGECSSTAIRAIIEKMIANENRKKPLSDSKIAQLIAAKGIHVARRTVAKYREALRISPSNERKEIRN